MQGLFLEDEAIEHFQPIRSDSSEFESFLSTSDPDVPQLFRCLKSCSMSPFALNIFSDCRESRWDFAFMSSQHDGDLWWSMIDMLRLTLALHCLSVIEVYHDPCGVITCAHWRNAYGPYVSSEHPDLFPFSYVFCIYTYASLNRPPGMPMYI